MADQIKLRRGTATQWTSSDPVLAVGELGFETDTNKFKLGNGSDTWSDLVYFVDENGVDLSLYAPLSSPTFTGDVQISGNLVVSGSTSYINSQDLVVDDSLIYLANSSSANVVDIGIVGSFDNGTYQHTGLVRDASSDQWILFKGVQTEPTTTVAFTEATFDKLLLGEISTTSATIGNVSNTEIQYLNNVSSNIQTQLDSKINKLITVQDERLSSFTVASGDEDDLIQLNGTFTVTVPAQASYDFPIGTQIHFLNVGSGTITFSAGNSTLNGTPGLKLRAQWSAATLIKRKSDSWVLVGDLSA